MMYKDQYEVMYNSIKITIALLQWRLKSIEIKKNC